MRSGSRLRMLIVEDDPIVSRTVGRTFAMRGYSIVTASCCAEARSAEGRFDVGVFDIELPDGDGVRLAESLIRAGVVHAVTFYSATMSTEAISSAARVGGFVHKADGTAVLAENVERSVAATLRAVAVGAEDTPTTEARPLSGFRAKVPR